MRSMACATALCVVVALGHAAVARCAGDCNGDGAVTIDELVTLIDCVFRGLGEPPCPCVGSDRALDITFIIHAVGYALAGCPAPAATPTPTPPPATPTATVTGAAEEFVAQASDFECLTHWSKVRQFRIVNKAGHGPEALAVASASYDVSGLEFPVGTIVQLIPTEAMVKRGGGFDPANHDWEYFSLHVSKRGTTIATRGRDDVINFAGGNCFSCHAAARRYDFICESTHGCAPIPITDDVVNLLQMNDIRCQP